MFFFGHFTKSSDEHTTVPVGYEPTPLTVAAPESVGTILGKVSLIWAGLFAGITLGDVVLIATLVYTVLQICLAVYERIIKPLQAANEAARLVRELALVKMAVENSGPVHRSNDSQEK